MRTYEQITQIKQRMEDPYGIKDFVTPQDIAHLIQVFETDQNKTHKNTGPITVDLLQYLNDPVVSKIIKELKQKLGPFEITAAMFFSVTYPHIIHNDDTFELPDGVFKGITIPLKIYGNTIPKLCFFNQCYFHGPAKFFNGDDNIPTYFNQQVYDYKLVDNLSTEQISEKMRMVYLSHLKPEWLHQLSIHSMLDWTPGDALIFDSVRLHCASDFRRQGTTGKLGISIFTKVV